MNAVKAFLVSVILLALVGVPMSALRFSPESIVLTACLIVLAGIMVELTEIRKALNKKDPS